MHPFVAELCVESRRNMLTASYATDALRKIAKRLVIKTDTRFEHEESI